MKKINFKKIKKDGGFVLLFAVTLAAIFLSIALGISQVALKENNFSTSAIDTNNAFFAADTGAEQVLYNDLNQNSYSSPSTTTVYVSGLGSNGQSCAIVTITKTSSSTTPPIVSTSVVSKGYNVGSGSGTCIPPASAVERELDTNY
jgi:Tfp pilus assembly protein PilX